MNPLMNHRYLIVTNTLCLHRFIYNLTRKVCNHPFLFGEPKDELTNEYLGEKDPEWLIQVSGNSDRIHKCIGNMLILIEVDKYS